MNHGSGHSDPWKRSYRRKQPAAETQKKSVEKEDSPTDHSTASQSDCPILGPCVEWRAVLEKFKIRTLTEIQFSFLCQFPIRLRLRVYGSLTTVTVSDETDVSTPDPLARSVITNCNGFFVSTGDPSKIICPPFPNLLDYDSPLCGRMNWSHKVTFMQHCRGKQLKLYWYDNGWQLGSEKVPNLSENEHKGQNYLDPFNDAVEGKMKYDSLSKACAYYFILRERFTRVGEKATKAFDGIVHFATIDIPSGLEVFPSPDIGLDQPETYPQLKSIRDAKEFLANDKAVPGLIAVQVTYIKPQSNFAFVRREAIRRRSPEVMTKCTSIIKLLKQPTAKPATILGPHSFHRIVEAVRKDFPPPHIEGPPIRSSNVSKALHFATPEWLATLDASVSSTQVTDDIEGSVSIEEHDNARDVNQCALNEMLKFISMHREQMRDAPRLLRSLFVLLNKAIFEELSMILVILQPFVEAERKRLMEDKVKMLRASSQYTNISEASLEELLMFSEVDRRFVQRLNEVWIRRLQISEMRVHPLRAKSCVVRIVKYLKQFPEEPLTILLLYTAVLKCEAYTLRRLIPFINEIHLHEVFQGSKKEHEAWLSVVKPVSHSTVPNPEAAPAPGEGAEVQAAGVPSAPAEVVGEDTSGVATDGECPPGPV